MIARGSTPSGGFHARITYDYPSPRRAMTEPLTTEEVALAITEGHRSRERGAWREELIEILEGLLLAIVAVATAWSALQAARWDGKEGHLYGLSSAAQTLAIQSSTEAGQLELYDSTTFSFWLQAHAEGNSAAQQTFAERFRPEFRPAFDAWLKTDPFHNPDAPAGPIAMPQYRNAETAKAKAFERRAAHDFEEGTRARERAEKYLSNSVVLAMVLFLIAVAQRFKIVAVRRSLLGVAGVVLVLALYFILTYPTT
jgi:hypothetical protein